MNYREKRKLRGELKTVSTGSWLTDNRWYKVCAYCTHYEKTEYAWLCKKAYTQFKVLDSPYHTTCPNFKQEIAESDDDAKRSR